MSRRWRERDHPRDDQGRFRDKDEWARRISATIGGYAPRAHGRNLFEEDISFKEMAQDAAQLGHTDGLDTQLALVYQMQGYNGPPTVVTPEQFDELVTRGEIQPLYRGVKTASDGMTAAQMHDSLRHGAVHWAGLGGYGNGTYATPDLLFAESYADGYPSTDSVARMALRPDARVTTRAELEKLYFDQYSYDGQQRQVMDRYLAELEKAPKDAGRLTREHQERSLRLRDRYSRTREDFIGDYGRFAALLGYDAYWAAPLMSGGHRELVILNRTALIVDAAPTPPQWLLDERKYMQRVRERDGG